MDTEFGSIPEFPFVPMGARSASRLKDLAYKALQGDLQAACEVVRTKKFLDAAKPMHALMLYCSPSGKVTDAQFDVLADALSMCKEERAFALQIPDVIPSD